MKKTTKIHEPIPQREYLRLANKKIEEIKNPKRKKNTELTTTQKIALNEDLTIQEKLALVTEALLKQTKYLKKLNRNMLETAYVDKSETKELIKESIIIIQLTGLDE